MFQLDLPQIVKLISKSKIVILIKIIVIKNPIKLI